MWMDSFSSQDCSPHTQMLTQTYCRKIHVRTYFTLGIMWNIWVWQMKRTDVTVVRWKKKLWSRWWEQAFSVSVRGHSQEAKFTFVLQGHADMQTLYNYDPWRSCSRWCVASALVKIFRCFHEQSMTLRLVYIQCWLLRIECRDLRIQMQKRLLTFVWTCNLIRPKKNQMSALT